MIKLHGSCWMVLGVLASLTAAKGSQYNYTGADAGLWNTAANWTLNGGATHLVPVNGDDANLGLALTVSSVVFSATYTGAGLNSLTLDSPGHASITLNQTSASTIIATTEYIGTTVSGNFYNQSAGTNTANFLTLGYANGGFGNYTLSGTGVLNTAITTIGNAGTGGGTFNQSGGTHNVSGLLNVGSSGTNLNNAYNLSGGTLAMASAVNIYVGSGVKGAFTQSAGAVSFASSTGSIIVGYGNGTGSLYTLSGTGTITGAGALTIGYLGSGTFTQTGGTNTLSGIGLLSIGDQSSSTGAYNLSATTGTGALNVTNANVGNNGNGTFTQNGGTFTASNSLTVGNILGSTGLYTLNSGALNAANPLVGNGGTGTFTQNGGTLTVSGVSGLTAGYTTGSSGTITLNSGAVNLSAGGSMFVGSNGTGILNQSGGTINGSGSGGIWLGYFNGGNGTFNLSGGSTTIGYAQIGANSGSTGQVNQTGGTLNVNAVGGSGLVLGVIAGASGSYTIDATAGASALNTTTLRVGDSGTGTITQNGGTVTVNAVGTIGRLAGSNGTYNLNGGILNAGVNPTPANVFVGASGTGTMNQTGGIFTVGGGAGASLSLGATGGSGTYNLSGGSLTTQLLQPGNGGTGNFIQNGGTVNATQLNISSVAGSNGSYTLSGGSGVTLGVSNFEAIGVSASGTFTQNGGTHTLSGDMQLGQSATGAGTYNLNGGVLNANANIGVGQSGQGLLNQTGGTLGVGLGLYVGSGSGSNGSYQISAGTAIVGTLYLGYSGVGNLYQNGGALTVGTLYGGTLFSNFTGATGAHTQTGGTLNVTSAFYLGIGGAAAAYTLGGSSVLNAPNNPISGQDLFIGPNGTFTQYGGTVNGYVVNSGQFVFQGGTFNGTYENAANGVATFSSFVYLGAGLKNHGTINIPANGQVGTAAGQTFSNDGTINLSGTGQIYSNGPVINNGLITGTGSIAGSSTFVNNLSITQGVGPLTFSFAPGTATNNGTVTLASGRALNLFGGLTNAGTLKLNGASILQNGTLANAAGGTLSGPGTILTTFTNSGIVTPGGGTLNIANAWTNNGLVLLNGIADSLTGGLITNAGTIQGYGNVGAAVSTASGVIEAIGGNLSIGGTLLNPSGGTLAVGVGSKLVVTSGLTTSAGIISLTGGTFDNNNHAMTNTGQISGYGIFRTGGAGLTNAGSITFTGGNTTVNGNVTNNAGQTVRISYTPATFTGTVVNNGTFKTTSTTSTFAGTFTNNGVFTSDPATQIFSTLIVGTHGTLIGCLGDKFVVTENFLNNSEQSVTWTTTNSELSFSSGTAPHTVALAGADVGPSFAGYQANFAWGIVRIASGQAVTLTDGNATAGAALYVDQLLLGGGVAQIPSITGNGSNIYYNPYHTANTYLGGRTYPLTGGGAIQPIAADLKIIAVRSLPNGHFQMDCQGVPNVAHHVQFSPDLTTTFTLLSTITAAADGTFQYEDVNAGNFTRRFYRVALP